MAAQKGHDNKMTFADHTQKQTVSPYRAFTLVCSTVVFTHIPAVTNMIQAAEPHCWGHCQSKLMLTVGYPLREIQEQTMSSKELLWRSRPEIRSRPALDYNGIIYRKWWTSGNVFNGNSRTRRNESDFEQQQCIVHNTVLRLGELAGALIKISRQPESNYASSAVYILMVKCR